MRYKITKTWEPHRNKHTPKWRQCPSQDGGRQRGNGGRAPPQDGGVPWQPRGLKDNGEMASALSLRTALPSPSASLGDKGKKDGSKKNPHGKVGADREVPVAGKALPARVGSAPPPPQVTSTRCIPEGQEHKG